MICGYIQVRQSQEEAAKKGGAIDVDEDEPQWLYPVRQQRKATKQEYQVHRSPRELEAYASAADLFMFWRNCWQPQCPAAP